MLFIYPCLCRAPRDTASQGLDLMWIDFTTEGQKHWSVNEEDDKRQSRLNKLIKSDRVIMLLLKIFIWAALLGAHWEQKCTKSVVGVATLC